MLILLAFGLVEEPKVMLELMFAGKEYFRVFMK